MDVLLRYLINIPCEHSSVHNHIYAQLGIVYYQRYISELAYLPYHNIMNIPNSIVVQWKFILCNNLFENKQCTIYTAYSGEVTYL